MNIVEDRGGVSLVEGKDLYRYNMHKLNATKRVLIQPWAQYIYRYIHLTTFLDPLTSRCTIVRVEVHKQVDLSEGNSTRTMYCAVLHILLQREISTAYRLL